MRRTPFIDHLRVALTALVIFHHTALVYGARGAWYLVERPQGSSSLLALFCTLNQAFFMGFFFLLAGYFTPGALARKGRWRFARDRLARLGLPLLFFGLVLDPLTVALARAQTAGGFVEAWAGMIGRGWFSSGPLWFAEALLAFTAVFWLWRRFRPEPAVPSVFPSHRTLFAAAFAVGIGAFLLRLAFPVGWTVSNLQPGYFASYVVLFAAGVIGARGRWLERVAWRQARPWLIVSALTFLATYAAVKWLGPGSYGGGWSVRAGIYAFFEPFFAWGVILGLVLLFRTWFNRPAAWLEFLSRRAFAVYVMHPVVLVAVTRLFAPWQAPALAKFAVTGSVACLGCVMVASVARLRSVV